MDVRHIKSKINQYETIIRNKICRNRQHITLCVISTAIWGLLAHAYIFLNSSFSHDSLAEFNAADYGSSFKYAAGRWFVPIYRAFTRSDITLPWLIGLLSILWIAAAVVLISKMFGITSKPMIFLTSGIMTANVTVSLTAATFIHDLDCDMLALLLAVLAAYLWNRYERGYIFGMPCIMLSLALYQSYISAALTTIIMSLVMAVMNSENLKKVFHSAARGAIMILGGGGGYYLSIKLSPLLTGMTLSTGSNNSVTQIFSISAMDIPRRIVAAYMDLARKLKYMPGLNCPKWLQFAFLIMLICIMAAAVMTYLLKKEVKLADKAVVLALLMLLPLGMNVTYVLNNGINNELTIYAFWFTYLFALLLAGWLGEQRELKNGMSKKIVKGAASLVVILILLLNVRLANAMYLKKDMEADATLSYMTRVTYLLEEQDDYIPGQTRVVFVGTPKMLDRHQVFAFDEYFKLNGLRSSSSISIDSPRFFQTYYRYILENPLIVEEDRWDSIRSEPAVADMPCYPDEGCIRMVDGIMVVRLG